MKSVYHGSTAFLATKSVDNILNALAKYSLRINDLRTWATAPIKYKARSAN